MRAIDFVEHVSACDCQCQRSALDVQRNRHHPRCLVGRAQLFLGERVYVEGDGHPGHYEVGMRVECEHGVLDGDWCEACNVEHKRAAEQNQ